MQRYRSRWAPFAQCAAMSGLDALVGGAPAGEEVEHFEHHVVCFAAGVGERDVERIEAGVGRYQNADLGDREPILRLPATRWVAALAVFPTLTR